MTSLIRRLLTPIAYFSNNLLSRIGIWLVTVATILWLFALPALVRGETSNPYAGILLLVILPAVFFLGLVLIPVGALLKRRSSHQTSASQPAVIDLRSPAVRNLYAFIALATGVNVIIGSQLAYSSVNYVEGVSFCGTSCHVMRPEYVAYQRSVHARVDCVKCHAGPGVSGFVESKMAGVRQLVQVTFNTYPRPIPPKRVPLESSETCERCHDRLTDHGDRLRIISKFTEDQPNSRTATVVVMHVGGGNPLAGIHGAHLSPGVKTEFATDPKDPQRVLWVRRRAADGTTTVYLGEGVTAAEEGTDEGRARAMECLDCHNRVAHPMELPDSAVDRAMASGDIAPDLPFVKREAVRILKAGTDVRGAVLAFYAQNYSQMAATGPGGRAADIAKAASVVEEIYKRNVFPELGVAWGTHPDNIGHTDSPGCWRCHDSKLTSKDGKMITQDCSACHNLVAMDEANPKILDELGVAPPKK
jgi:nitrate/TMAO reductase-like tetraheme cytochrome c subunit